MPTLLVFAVAFCTYLATATASIGWLDSPELVAAAASLGVAHSPGHPLPAFLGRLAGYFPIGDMPFRVAILSAACAAAAVACVFAIGRALLAKDRSDRWATAIAALAAAGVATSWALWMQGTRAEVYALQAVLLVAAIGCVVAYEEKNQPRWLLLGGLTGGLALANHHFMAVLCLAPALAVVLVRRKRPALATVSAMV